MKFKYPDHHKWVKEVSREDVFLNFGKNAQYDLRATIHKILESSIRHEVQPMGQEFLSWFIPMYKENILSKNNPVLFAVEERVLGGQKKYYSLALYENDVPLGGTIFTVTEEGHLSIAYRAYSNNWTNHSYRARPSLYTEYLIEQYARDIGCTTIIHGRDRNPYGVNSGIGLGMYKLAMGCQPYVSKSHTIREFDTGECPVDTFIFVAPDSDDGKITKAYLIAAPETVHKWEGVTKYPERVGVDVILRKS